MNTQHTTMLVATKTPDPRNGGEPVSDNPQVVGGQSRSRSRSRSPSPSTNSPASNSGVSGISTSIAHSPNATDTDNPSGSDSAQAALSSPQKDEDSMQLDKGLPPAAAAAEQTDNNKSISKIDLAGKTSEEQTSFELRLLVRRREAGALIGKRGMNIKRLRETFRSSVFSIPDTGNGPERVVCVVTNEKAMEPILGDIAQLLVEKSPEKDDQIELKLLIHSSQAGSIIGMGGQTIKKLRNESRAAIKIYELCCPFSNERVCAVKAKPPVVVSTIRLIQSILNENPIKGTIKPYDALHFDLMLVDKYGGYLPEDNLDLLAGHQQHYDPIHHSYHHPHPHPHPHPQPTSHLSHAHPHHFQHQHSHNHSPKHYVNQVWRASDNFHNHPLDGCNLDEQQAATSVGNNYVRHQLVSATSQQQQQPPQQQKQPTKPDDEQQAAKQITTKRTSTNQDQEVNQGTPREERTPALKQATANLEQNGSTNSSTRQAARFHPYGQNDATFYGRLPLNDCQPTSVRSIYLSPQQQRALAYRGSLAQLRASHQQQQYLRMPINVFPDHHHQHLSSDDERCRHRSMGSCFCLFMPSYLHHGPTQPDSSSFVQFTEPGTFPAAATASSYPPMNKTGFSTKKK